MKEKVTWICKKCGSKDFYTKAKGPHIGVYCSHCNAWLKWMKQGSGLKAKQTITDEPNRSPVKAIVETQLLKDEVRHVCEETEKDEVPWI